MSFFQVNNNCNGCLACVQNCPASALDYADQGEKRKLLHNMTRCARCGNCWRVCPNEAVEFQHLLRGDWDEVVKMDLVRCTICGDPLYTAEFSHSLTQRVEHDIHAICPKHRKSLPLDVWRRLTPDKSKQEEGEK